LPLASSATCQGELGRLVAGWAKIRSAVRSLGSGGSYSTTRVLLKSGTYRFPRPSSARPLGGGRLSAGGARLLKGLVLKPGWPKTWSALRSVISGASYSSTRLLAESATYKLPATSSATLYGEYRLLALRPP